VASITSVPLPHIGFMKFPLPFQRAASIVVAASVSCMGSFKRIFLYPCRDRGLPGGVRINKTYIFLPGKVDERTVSSRAGIGFAARLSSSAFGRISYNLLIFLDTAQIHSIGLFGGHPYNM